jgi:hypothetical protein
MAHDVFVSYSKQDKAVAETWQQTSGRRSSALQRVGDIIFVNPKIAVTYSSVAIFGRERLKSVMR